MSELINIPANMKTNFLRETESVEMPEIRAENGRIIIPCFIRQETRTENENEQTFYRYFEASVPNIGQNIFDYAICIRQSYAALRKHFYGDWATQNEQILKGEFVAHQYAVRQAFPKAEGENIAAVERFDAIKTEFWNTVDAACTVCGKTRSALPAEFNAEEMLSFAATNGMSTADISTYTAKFSVISLNLLQNGRNWDELF